MKTIVLTLFFIFSLIQLTFSQRGKDGNVTISAPNTVVNTYTSLLSNASAGNTTISVTSNALNGAGFSGNLAQGDLIMIYQTQGVWAYLNSSTDYGVNLDWYNSYSWGGSAVPIGYGGSGAYQNAEKYGTVRDYSNAGYYEIREVQSVSG
ncbi:MAG TPA: hypothetical protein PKN22_12300, partial [Taishania sp.]|nr:hypothetical protein [Taishania sp.]